jgi:Spy/CpxP family protein refolding chaperone
MRDVWKAFVAVGFVALLAGPAPAQRGDLGVPGVSGRPWQLLANASVQKELKLTDGQKEKARTLIADLRKKRGEAFQNLRGATRAEREKERQKLIEKLDDDAEKQVAKLLDAKQQKRFKQIRVFVAVKQGGLPAAFRIRGMATSLKLTDGQKEKIADLWDDYLTRVRTLSGGPRPPEQKKLAELRKEFNEKYEKVLTDGQKKSLKDLQGPKFDYKPTGLGGRGGGPRQAGLPLRAGASSASMYS